MDFDVFCLFFSSIYAVSLSLLMLIPAGTGKQMSMKIVDEPSNLGMYNPYQADMHTDVLTMRVQPSNFSGPPHLRALDNLCFTKIDDTYKYEFCPFSNLTQHEQSLRWNPYSGILGVWQEWEIINNTFVAMVMREGDSCGELYRSTKVLLKCGRKNEIEKVTEPQTCQYEMKFVTPLVCHPHAMLVYPTLSKEHQQRWDVLQTQLVNEDITQKGYDKRLHKLFEGVGYQLPEEKVRAISKQAKTHEQQVAQHEQGEFDSLDKCTEEYKKLKEEIDGLRTLLQLYQGNDTYAGRQHMMGNRYDMYHYDED